MSCHGERVPNRWRGADGARANLGDRLAGYCFPLVELEKWRIVVSSCQLC